MSDHDIVIKLDPTQPVAGAKAVVAGVAGIEDQGKKAQSAMDNVASAAKSLKSIDFKQAAAAGAAAWGQLSAKLDIANTAIGETIDSAVKFGAIGAQIAGPWGAALGAIGGWALEATDNITGLKSAVTDLAEESKKIAQDHLAKMSGKLGELAREAKRHAEATQDQYVRLLQLPAALGEVYKAFSNEADIVKRAREEIEKYNAAKFKASPQGNAVGGFFGGVTGADRSKPGTGTPLVPGYAGSPFGDAWTKPRDVYKGLGESAGTDALEQFELAKLAQDSLNEKIKANADETLRLAANTRKWNEELEAANGFASVIAGQLTNAATSFADALVDAANGADVSWSNFFGNLFKNFQKALAQAIAIKAIGSPGGGVGGGYGGLLGLLGFASGGVIGPSGSGTTDTQTMMFRKAPSETVRIHTPAQEAAYSGGGGGGPINLTVNPQIHDERAIQSAMAGPGGQRVIYNVVRQALGAIRPLG